MADQPSLTRRGLFRGVGTATVLSGCGPRAVPGRTDNAGNLVLEGEVPLAFTLDGAPQQLAVEPSRTLLSVLRHDADATAPKEVCDRGACGACSVLVDGEPRLACTLLAHDVEGANVETASGVASTPEGQRLQQAFVARDALQCGYCTSGMMVQSTALLRRGGGQSEAEVRHQLAGNLCRCGTYPNLIRAVMDAAGGTEAKPG